MKMVNFTNFNITTDMPTLKQTQAAGPITLSVSAVSLSAGGINVYSQTIATVQGDSVVRMNITDSRTGRKYIVNGILTVDAPAGYRSQLVLRRVGANLILAVWTANMLGTTVNVPTQNFTAWLRVNKSTFVP